LALAGLGAGGAVFSGLEFLAEWRLYFLGAAVLVLSASWVMFFRRRTVACSVDGSCATSTPTKRTAALLGIGTAFVALSVVWDALIEPLVFKLVR
jgi:mercuric ion transport protein